MTKRAPPAGRKRTKVSDFHPELVEELKRLRDAKPEAEFETVDEFMRWLTEPPKRRPR